MTNPPTQHPLSESATSDASDHSVQPTENKTTSTNSAMDVDSPETQEQPPAVQHAPVLTHGGEDTPMSDVQDKGNIEEASDPVRPHPAFDPDAPRKPDPSTMRLTYLEGEQERHQNLHNESTQELAAAQSEPAAQATANQSVEELLGDIEMPDATQRNPATISKKRLNKRHENPLRGSPMQPLDAPLSSLLPFHFPGEAKKEQGANQYVRDNQEDVGFKEVTVREGESSFGNDDRAINVKIMLTRLDDAEHSKDNPTHLVIGSLRQKRGKYTSASLETQLNKNWLSRAELQIKFMEGSDEERKSLMREPTEERPTTAADYEMKKVVVQKVRREACIVIPHYMPLDEKDVLSFRVTKEVIAMDDNVAGIGEQLSHNDSGVKYAIEHGRLIVFQFDANGKQLNFGSTFQPKSRPTHISIDDLHSTELRVLNWLRTNARDKDFRITLASIGDDPKKQIISSDAMGEHLTKTMMNFVRSSAAINEDDPVLAFFSSEKAVGKFHQRGNPRDRNNPPALLPVEQWPKLRYRQNTHPVSVYDVYIMEGLAAMRALQIIQYRNVDATAQKGELRLITVPGGGSRIYLGFIRYEPGSGVRLDNETSVEIEFLDTEGNSRFVWEGHVRDDLAVPYALSTDIAVLIRRPINDSAVRDAAAPAFDQTVVEHVFNTTTATPMEVHHHLLEGAYHSVKVFCHESDREAKRILRACLRVSAYCVSKVDLEQGLVAWAQPFKTGCNLDRLPRFNAMEFIREEVVSKMKQGLTEQQAGLYQYLTSITQRLAIVIGPAGTGKTLLIIRYILAAAYSGKKILVMCKSNLLADQLVDRLVTLAPEFNVDPKHIHRLFTDSVNKQLLRSVLDTPNTANRFRRYRPEECDDNTDSIAAKLVTALYSTYEAEVASRHVRDRRVRSVKQTVFYQVLKEGNIEDIMDKKAEAALQQEKCILPAVLPDLSIEEEVEGITVVYGDDGQAELEDANDDEPPPPKRMTDDQRQAFVSKYGTKNVTTEAPTERQRAIDTFCAILKGYHAGERGEKLVETATTDFKNILVDTVHNHTQIAVCTPMVGSESYMEGSFNIVWVEEAQTFNELDRSLFLAFHRNAFYIHSGDPKQIDTITTARLHHSDDEALMNFPLKAVNRNILELDSARGWDVWTLHENHRSHPDLVELANIYYHDQLIATKPSSDFPIAAQIVAIHRNILNSELDSPVCMLHVGQAHEELVGPTLSKRNLVEASAVFQYVTQLLKNGVQPEKILVITGYLAQLQYMRATYVKMADNRSDDSFPRQSFLEVAYSSVFRTAGSENEVVIFCMTSTDSPGFIDTAQFLVTAITRAKGVLIVIGNFHKLLNSVRTKAPGGALHRLMEKLLQDNRVFSYRVDDEWMSPEESEQEQRLLRVAPPQDSGNTNDAWGTVEPVAQESTNNETEEAVTDGWGTVEPPAKTSTNNKTAEEGWDSEGVIYGSADWEQPADPNETAW